MNALLDLGESSYPLTMKILAFIKSNLLVDD